MKHVIGLIGLVVMMSYGWASPFVTPQTFIDDDASRLLVASGKENEGLSIYSLAPWGGDRRLIIKSSVRGRGDYEAAVSPDGNQLAFTTYRYGGWKIALANIDGSNVRRVTKDGEYAYDPHFSPDGKSLVYRRIVPSGGAYWRGQADVFRINLDGTGNRNISNTAKDGDRKAAYSPDGQWIIFDSFKNNDGKALWIMKMKPDGSQLQRIKGDSQWMFAPSWSADGQWIAHLRTDTEDHVDVWVMRADGSEAKNLTKAKARGFKPAGDKIRHWQYDTSWGLNGKYVTFVSNYADQDNIDIYAVDIKTGQIARLTSGEQDDVHPFLYKTR